MHNAITVLNSTKKSINLLKICSNIPNSENTPTYNVMRLSSTYTTVGTIKIYMNIYLESFYGVDDFIVINKDLIRLADIHKLR